MDDNMNERRQFTGVPVSGVPEQRRIFVEGAAWRPGNRGPRSIGHEAVAAVATRQSWPHQHFKVGESCLAGAR